MCIIGFKSSYKIDDLYPGYIHVHMNIKLVNETLYPNFSLKPS